MATPQEVRETLPGRLAALGVQATDFAHLAGWSPSGLSNFLAGRRTNQHIDDVNGLNLLIAELERIALLLRPIPLDFGNTNAIRALLDLYRKGAISFYSNDEDVNNARCMIVLCALTAAEKEAQRAAAVAALVEGQI
jgi:hypothetical protein